MDRKSLINFLELAYAPLTAYEFALLKDDHLIEKALEFASLYIIAQRPVITFENVYPDLENYSLKFEIHQKGSETKLKCKLPLIQKVVGSEEFDNITVSFNFLDKFDKQESPPFKNIHGFSLAKRLDSSDEFLIWFSPEKLLQNWWKGHVECEIIGDYKKFLNYKVHYVGKATKQSILKRLTGHSTFQDILSLEAPVTNKQLPANEIVILPFEFHDNLQIVQWGLEFDTNSLVDSMMGKLYPDKEKVFLDAEKALIKAIQPQYNKELFSSYPKSKDGLYNDNYNAISYTFIDPLRLIYSEGEIVGGLSPFGGDFILILNNDKFEVVKHEK